MKFFWKASAIGRSVLMQTLDLSTKKESIRTTNFAQNRGNTILKSTGYALVELNEQNLTGRRDKMYCKASDDKLNGC